MTAMKLICASFIFLCAVLWITQGSSMWNYAAQTQTTHQQSSQ